MKYNHANIPSLIRKQLEKMPLFIKFLFLVIIANLLFPLFVRKNTLSIYYHFFFPFVILLTFLYRLIIGRNAFRLLLVSWSIGAFIYLLFAIPLVYSSAPLSPYIELSNIFDRWLYSLAIPLRILGVLSVGLIFINITSPIEFLKWGQIGWKIALLLRAIQYVSHNFHETKLALMMQNEWPEEKRGLISIKEGILSIRYSPTLVATTFRNIILWFPWAWLCFNKLQETMKGGSR
jgi:hypothetical protein